MKSQPTILPILFQIFPRDTPTARAIGRVERKYPWLGRCHSLWGPIKAGGCFDLLSTSVIENSRDLRALFPSGTKPALTWRAHFERPKSRRIRGFLEDLFRLFGPSTRAFFEFDFHSGSGWRQSMRWCVTLESNGRLSSESECYEWADSLPELKLPRPSLTRARAAHLGGVRQAWSLPAGQVLSLGVEGDLRRWNARTGDFLGMVRTPGPVLHGAVLGDALCYVTDTEHLGIYDVRRHAPLSITDVSSDVNVWDVKRIESLGHEHLAVATSGRTRYEVVHVLGPFPHLPGKGVSRRLPAARRSESGTRAAEHAVVGSGIVAIGKVPIRIEPLDKGRKTEFHPDDPEHWRRRREIRSLVVAGRFLVTNIKHWVHVWDCETQRLLGSVRFLDGLDKEPDDEGEIIRGMFGFPSGLVLSYGPRRMQLWSAKEPELRRLLLGNQPSGVFMVGEDRLVTWDEGGWISSWSFRDAGTERWVETVIPLLIEPHHEGLDGVCHLSGNQLLSWSSSDPALRIWNFATGEYVRGLGA